METFYMTDLIPLLGLPNPPYGQTSYYVQCPCCDENPRKRHLNINLAKDVFRCPRCGVSGGIFDLYSLYTGVPRDKVYSALVERLKPSIITNRQKVKVVPQAVIKEYPITDIETRHATYSALLSKLTLSNDHLNNLRNRGFTDEEIRENGYKTTPVAGLQAIAKQLRAEGYYLSGVPGFYRTDDDIWTFVKDKRGILIPVRDLKGRIQGLQIRRDNSEKRKFRWVSSVDLKDGCKAEGWTHLAGKVKNSIIITEGPMKADVIHALSGATVLAVPGVQSLTQLSNTLEQLKVQGLEKVYTAFDMDMLSNPHVQSGFENLGKLLSKMGIWYKTYVWPTEYKGLDDFIWEHQMNRKRM